MTALSALRGSFRLLREEADRTVASRLGIAAVLVTAGGLLSGLGPVALKNLVDALSNVLSPSELHGSGAFISGSAIAYLAVLCSGRLLAELQMPLIGTAEERLFSCLRCRLLAHWLGLSTAFQARQQTGAVAYKVEQAVTGYRLLIFSAISGALPVTAEVGTLVLVLSSLSQPSLVATIGVTAVAYGFVIGRWTTLLKREAQNVVAASLDTQALLTDVLLNRETVKSFNAEHTVCRRYAGSTELLELSWRGLHRQRGRMGLALAAVFTTSIAASLAFSIPEVMHGSLTIGGFVLANLSMIQMVRPMETLGGAVREMSQALELIRPALSLLAEPLDPVETTDMFQAGETVNSPVTSRTPAMLDQVVSGWRSTPGIRFRDVRFGYDASTPVLKGLSVDIQAGSTVAIVGSSGSGKSSVARLLLCLYQPQAGSISLDEVRIDRRDGARVRSIIGLVPQDVVLFNATVAANIRIGNDSASRADVEAAARLACLHDFILALPDGYDTMVGERGMNLSGGERQRLAIARVVLKQPLVYVLDEATSMLDSITERLVLRNLGEATAAKTTIMIAHRLSSIQHVDDIIVMDDGRVVEQGDHRHLLAAGGAYLRLWQAQQGKE